MRCCRPSVGMWQARRACTGASMHWRQHARLPAQAPAAQCGAVMAAQPSAGGALQPELMSRLQRCAP